MDLHGEVLATPERAPNPGEVDPDHLGREGEARRDLVAIDVEPLRRHVDVDPALAVGDREARLGAEERLVLLADLVRARHGHVALGIRVAAVDHHRADDVRPGVVAEPVSGGRPAGMDRLELDGPLGIDDRLELLVLDLDGGGRAPRLLGLLCRHQRDRLGTVLTVDFVLDGQPYTALNGGPQFTFNEALSLLIVCADQAEIDHYWNKLSAGGEEGPCGWLKDRYGVSWQVTPADFVAMLAAGQGAGPGYERAFAAMLEMKKLDIAALMAAAGE